MPNARHAVRSSRMSREALIEKHSDRSFSVVRETDDAEENDSDDPERPGQPGRTGVLKKMNQT